MTRTRPRIGVVTVTFNSGDVLPSFLESIHNQIGVDIDLYVVDNASSDGSADMAERAASNARTLVFRNVSNLGVAEGNNIGIRQALVDGHEWVLLLNNDTEFGPTLLADLLATAVDAGAEVLSPVIEGDVPVGTLWYGGGRTVPRKAYRAVHDEAGRVAASTRVTRQPVEETNYAPTCCLLVSRRVFDVVGLMDASYFVYYDDVDFNLRCRRAGIPYYLTSRARMLHKAGSISGRGRTTFTAVWLPRNWVLIVRRFARTRLGLIGALVYIEAHLLVGGLIAHDPWSRVVLRQKSFWKGLRADLSDHSAPAP